MLTRAPLASEGGYSPRSPHRLILRSAPRNKVEKTGPLRLTYIAIANTLLQVRYSRHTSLEIRQHHGQL